MSRAGGNSGRLVPLAMLLVGACGYAMTFSLNRIAITEGIPVFPFVFWQGVGAGAVTLTLTLSPILTYAFSILFRLDRVHLLRVAGILISLAGILLVLVPDTSLPEPGMALWLLMAFGAPVCYAFGTVTVAILRPADSKPIPLTCGIAFASAVLMLPVMAAADSWWLFDASMSDGDWSVIGAAAITAALFVLGLEIIRMAGPVFFLTNGYIGPLAGMGWAALYFGEVSSPWIGAAVALLFAGLFLVNRSTPPAAPAGAGR